MIWLLLAVGSAGNSDPPNPDLSGVEKQVAARIRVWIEKAQQNPRSAEAWAKLAMNLDVHDFKEESIPCYKHAMELAPEEFKWPYYCALVLQELGSPEAITLFERSCALNSKYGPAHYRYGQALLDAGRLWDAAREFRLAAELSAGASHPHVGLAKIALIEGRPEEAFTHLLEAIRKNPKHGEARGLLSEVYRRMGRPAEANEQWVFLQQLPPKTPPDDPLLADLLSQGVSSFWFEWRGRAYLQQGAYDHAIRELERAVQALPEARLYDTLGIALQYAKRYREAAQQHERALMANPNSAGTMNNLATALAATGEVTGAISFVEKAIESDPAFAYSYLHLSSLMLRQGKKADALTVLRKGHAALPEDTAIALRLAWMLATVTDGSLRSGREAAGLMEPLCGGNSSDSADCLDVLAAAYAETGKFDSAVETAKRAHQSAVLTNRTDYAKKIASRIKMYESNKPYRE